MRAARGIALLLLVAAAATAGEAGVRAFTRLSGRCHPTCLMRHDDVLGWTFRPGAVARHRDEAMGFDVTYHLNRDGHRSRDYPLERRAGMRRLLVLGDSNGFGWGVADDRHFSALIAAADPHVEVVNLSVSGYGTDQEYLRLQRDGLSFDPDVVVLQVTANDIADIGRARLDGRAKPRFMLGRTGELSLEPRPARPSLLERLLASCYACTWLHSRWPPRAAEPFDARTAAALFTQLVRTMGHSVAEAGATLLVVHAATELDDTLAGLPDSVPIDVSRRFIRAREAGQEPLFPDGLHWNARGHEVVATALREGLGAVPPRRTLRRTGYARP